MGGTLPQNRDIIVFVSRKSTAARDIVSEGKRRSGHVIGDGVVAQLGSFRRYRLRVCAAQYRLGPAEVWPEGCWGSLCYDNLHTTLVLEPDQPDFSTDASNSALILKSNLRTAPACRFSSVPVRRSKKTRTTFGTVREGTSCHGESCLDGNS